MDDRTYRRLCREHRIEDKERELWILNDEGLYNWWKSTRLPMTTFIRENRREIGEAILRVLGYDN